MKFTFQGSAICIDGVLDVDWDISPVEDAHFLKYDSTLSLSEDELNKHLANNCLLNVDGFLRNKIKKGDILIGNRGVGWGHGHDHAVLALKALGITVIICETSTMTFKRNCINHGLPIIEIPNIFYQFETGNKVEVNIREAWIKNISTNKLIHFPVFPDFIIDILEMGGIYAHLTQALHNNSIRYRTYNLVTKADSGKKDK